MLTFIGLITFDIKTMNTRFQDQDGETDLSHSPELYIERVQALAMVSQL
jgi:hypothetical protein